MSGALLSFQVGESFSGQEVGEDAGAQANRAGDAKASGGSFADALSSEMGEGQDAPQANAQSNFLSALANPAPAKSSSPGSFASQPSGSPSLGSQPSSQPASASSSLSGRPACESLAQQSSHAKLSSQLKSPVDDQAPQEGEPPESTAELAGSRSHSEISAAQSAQPENAGASGPRAAAKNKSASSKPAATTAAARAKPASAAASFAQALASPAIESAKTSAPHAATGSRAAVEHATVAEKKIASTSGKPSIEPAQTSGKNAATPIPSSSALAAGSSSAKSIAPAAPAAVPFAREADADPSLHLSLLPQAAHLRMDLDGAGALDLHLRLRDGMAHVTVSGPAAALVDSHSADLRSTLAGHGVSLASVAHVSSSEGAQSGGASGEEMPRDRSGGDRDPDSRESVRPATSAAQHNQAAFTISRSSASAASTFASTKARDSREESS